MIKLFQNSTKNHFEKNPIIFLISQKYRIVFEIGIFKKMAKKRTILRIRQQIGLS